MTDSWDLGNAAEDLVQAQIEASGWHHIADKQFDDAWAPMIKSDTTDIIRPDFMVSRRGRSVWIEVKAKQKPVQWNGEDPGERHGINKKNYDHYIRATSVTGSPCWMFLYELSTGLLLCQDLSTLPVVSRRVKDSYPPGDKYGEDMVFFKKTDFHEKQIANEHYPESFMGQDKLPLKNVADPKDALLFPGSSLGKDPRAELNRSLGDFATDGGDEEVDT